MKIRGELSEQRSGSIRLAGHRIALEHVVYFYNQGYSPEMVLGQFPILPLALIHKVIAFYLENQAAVDAYVQRWKAEGERQQADAPDLAELRRRAAQRSRSETR